MNDLPYIQKMHDGKYHLFCGVCHGSNPYVHEVFKTELMSVRSIVCGNHCRTGGGDNEICNISDIPKLATRDCDGEVKRAVIDVCETLGLNAFHEFGS